MLAYQYNEDKKFIGAIECDLDPLESEISGKEIWLLPADSTFKAPLPAKEGFDVCFDEVKDAWKYIAIPEPTDEEIKNSRIAELKAYLSVTDWYAVRFAETGVEIPDEIKVERQAAREEISRLRDDNDNAEG